MGGMGVDFFHCWICLFLMMLMLMLIVSPPCVGVFRAIMHTCLCCDLMYRDGF